jgi:hypothetical protein
LTALKVKSISDLRINLGLHWNRAQIVEQIFAYGKFLAGEKPAQQSVPCSDALLDLSSGPT